MSEKFFDTTKGLLPTSRARVAILSLRNVENHVSRACGYTFEDVIASDLDDAHIITPQYGRAGHQVLRAKAWLSRKFGDVTKLGSESISLNQDYDLFFFSAAKPRDLIHLDTIKNWRSRSRFAVCWLQELWMNDIRDTGKLLNIIEQFDHVICPFYHSTGPLQDRISVPVTYLTWGVDTKLFCPFPVPPRRAIDVCAIGEVSPAMHDALLDYAARTGQYYHYGTTHGHHAMSSHVAHRYNYANTLKRSRYFLSFLAKVVNTNQRGIQKEFGLRYVEGIAAGAVMLGSKVQNPAFEEYFGWEDSVVEVPFDSDAVVEVIQGLEADPGRVAEIQRNNVVNALRRHDHLHRWEKVLEISGLEPLAKMSGRRAELADLAHMAELYDPEIGL